MSQRPTVPERTSGWLETLGAVALFAMMAVTFVDIAGRFLLHRPLPGSTDLVQVLLLLTAGCTLPAVTWRGEHLSIGLFDGARPTLRERARRAIVAAVLALTFSALALLLWRHAGDTVTNGDVIGYLRLPVAPFVYALSALCLVAAAVGAALVPRALRRSPEDTVASAPLEHTGAAT
ncbi:TRAP transporter small permease [Ramlibacter sp.]|uniref:TRAP transporter small permease n=1 Tax=Ramlibacter sp. TaxID=1917967 RepID=UPI002FCBA50F